MTNLRLEPYAEEDFSLNEWIDTGMKQISWKLFENQEDWVYMSGELGEGRFPQVKGYEPLAEAFTNAFDEYVGWLRSYMFERYLIDLRLGNVDLGEELEDYLRDIWDDEYYEEWEAEARKYIFDDYAQTLGPDKAADLFGKAWPGWER